MDDTQDAWKPANPTGRCECGCGEVTSIAKRNVRGIRKGEHMRYVASHVGRSRTLTAMDPVVRFWLNVARTPRGCWLWLGQINEDGYGYLSVGSRTTGIRSLLAHRFSYELASGHIQDGLHLDHLCRVRHCVNPEHLEPVTPQVNILRGIGPAAINAAKTHCPRGHEYTIANTRHYVHPNRPSKKYRACRACDRERSVAKSQRRKNLAA